MLKPFRLLRFYTLATLGVFVAATIAMFTLQRTEERFFEQVQEEQQTLLAKAQAELARQNEAAARESLLAVHEQAHVTLTQVVANLLWVSDFAPVVARAQQLSVEPCRAPSADRRACLAELGRRIQALPGHHALEAKAFEAMRGTKVFKIKVWDLRGICVYSSEAAQIGDDGSANLGWRHAAAGKPASELTHRDRFSAFEGVVENRDLISTYVPVRDEKSGAVVGVFELYSDVTPFLEQIKAASRKFAALSTANEDRVERSAAVNRETLYDSSMRFLWTVGGLMALLYVASLLIVRYGQGIIDRQTRQQEQAAQREQQWHREKMAALAAMAANVSHEVGNPLAVIAAQAQQSPDVVGAKVILDQTARIAQMTRQISDFASARGETPEWVDVNAMVKAVCDFHAFDRRFRGVALQFKAGEGVPARELVPDHLNEVMMSLLQACADAAQAALSPRVSVETVLRGNEVVIRIAAAGVKDDARVETARMRVAQMGGRLSLNEGAIELVL